MADGVVPFVFPEDLRPRFEEVQGAQLYTVLSAPVGAKPTKGVLICPSLCYEYERSFRALRVLSAALAARGVPAMRFDYRGQANSSGATHIDMNQWAEDIETMVERLKVRANVDDIWILGFRFGALAAQLVAPNAAATRLAWYPPNSGAAFLSDLDARHKLETDGFGRDPSVYAGTILGHPLSSQSRNLLVDLTISLDAFDFVTGGERDGDSDSATFWEGGDDGLVPVAKIDLLAQCIADGSFV